MPSLTLYTWEQDFRAAAKKDRYDVFRDHMRFLDLPGRPISMLQATILVVRAMVAYHSIDGRRSDDFLAMQQYNPAKSEAPYLVTFALTGRIYARLLVDAELRSIDLADLYGHPWEPYRRSGYSQLWIAHKDWTDLKKKEMQTLERLVTDDLRFDYPEDELGFWFDDSNAKYLYVSVYDHEEWHDEQGA